MEDQNSHCGCGHGSKEGENLKLGNSKAFLIEFREGLGDRSLKNWTDSVLRNNSVILKRPG